MKTSATNAGPNEAQLIVLVRTMAQLEAALGCDSRTIYCEFEDPKKYREAVTRFRSNPQSAIRNPQFGWLLPGFSNRAKSGF